MKIKFCHLQCIIFQELQFIKQIIKINDNQSYTRKIKCLIPMILSFTSVYSLSLSQSLFNTWKYPTMAVRLWLGFLFSVYLRDAHSIIYFTYYLLIYIKKTIFNYLRKRLEFLLKIFILF